MKKSENSSHHLEVALLAVMFYQEAVCVSDPDSRVQLWLLQQGFAQPHRLARILWIQPAENQALNSLVKAEKPHK